MATASDVLARLLANLTLTDSTWDVSVGTPEYKIMESVANEIATAANNSTLQSYSFDINTKSGAALDAYVALFGIYRLMGYRATGTVTFSTSPLAVANYDIPMGTQVYVPPSSGNSVSAVYFQTLSPGLILIDTASTEIPVEATAPGSSGNVVANSINSVTTGLTGITTITNTSPTSGGSDPETDTQLRARWSATVFRNLAGTEDQFLAVALNAPGVSQATVVGPQVRYEEQDQIIPIFTNTLNMVGTTGGTFTISWNGGTTHTIAWNVTPATLQTTLTNTSGWAILPTFTWPFATPIVTGTTGVTYSWNDPDPTLHPDTGTGFTANLSGLTGGAPVFLSTDNFVTGWFSPTAPDVKYYFPPGGELIGQNIGQNDQVLMTPVDYTYYVNSSVTGQTIVIVSNTTGNFPPNTTVDFEYEYTPNCSRDNPGSNPPVTNKIDMFINGSSPQSVTEEILFNTAATFVASGPTGSQVLASNFLQRDGVSTPRIGDIYMKFSQQPILVADLPGFITIGPTNYYGGVDLTFTSQILVLPNIISWYPVIDVTNTQESQLSATGIAWCSPTLTSGPTTPANNTLVTVEYSFNQTVSDVNDLVQQVKLVGSDVLVHGVSYVQIQVNMKVVYGFDQSQTAIDVAIEAAIQTFFQSQTFLGAIRLSQLTQIVMGTGGVVNCSVFQLDIIPSDDFTPIASHTGDIYLDTNQLPVLFGTNITPTSQNTFTH